jgi:mRNA interferase MazF
MNIQIGNIYWIQFNEDIPHPHVVIKEPTIDSKDITVALITTNQKKSNSPGNVVLDENEGDLLKPSIVDVANVVKVLESDLGEYIGRLNEKRVDEIKSGIQFLERTYFNNRG